MQSHDTAGLRVTEDDGAVFYWHEATDTNQWEPPPHLLGPVEVAAPVPLPWHGVELAGVYGAHGDVTAFPWLKPAGDPSSRHLCELLLFLINK